MAGALEGVRVLDCTHVIAGAYCSLLLADLGADVVKIEPPAGEVTRGRFGSPFKPFDFINRNKRAVAIDVSSREGADVIRRMAETADVFVENYRPGAMARQGLDYDSLSKINPRIVYASISGFGQTGPYRDRGGLDLVAQAMSGIMSFTGEINSDRPMSAGVPLSDLNAGVFAALGVTAALNHRHVTGQGQYLETSLLEAALAYTVWETGMALRMGVVADRNGTRHRLAAPYEALKTADGYLVVGVNNQKLWARLCQALDAPDLAVDADFAEPFCRVANRDALQERLEAILAKDTTRNWVERISVKGVPCGPINTIAEALSDPQVVACGFVQEVDGERFPRTPLTLSGTPIALNRGAAAIGQHTREVLAETGYSATDIDRMMEKRVIAG